MRTQIEKDLNKSVERFEKRLLLLNKRFARVGSLKLLIFIIFLVFFFSLFFMFDGYLALSAFILFIPLGFFTRIQNTIGLAIKKNTKWIEIKKELIARMNLDWEKIPYGFVDKDDTHHPFAYDLSVSGQNSLIHLIDTSTSLEGHHQLLNKFLEPSINIETVKKRQQLVSELKYMEQFRLKLLLFGRLSSKKYLSGKRIKESLKTNINPNRLKRILNFLFILIPLNFGLFLLWLLNILPPYFSITTLIYIGIDFFNSRQTKASFKQTLDVEEELGRFYKIFNFLETFNFGKNKTTSEFCSAFKNNSPSYYLKQLSRINTAFAFQQNPVTAITLNFIFPWNFFFAVKLENLKSSLSEKIEAWLSLFYELEAVNSIATFATLNPEYTFPSLVCGENYFSLKAENIAHPLIPFYNNVKNNFSLDGKNKVCIVTGSNMSGKSTFIKCLGANIVIANAGGPVNASKMSFAPIRLFTCIKISDSVTDGISYFYAEVKRLKMLLDELKVNEKIPVFYLIDEIFKGTNNRERLEGSRSFINEIIKLNGSGLITTHDLELTGLESDGEIFNYHFREEASEGKMIFDYKLRKGPCPTTNALKIMKMEGLPVNLSL